MDKFTGRAFLSNGDIYYSPNSSRKVEVPSATDQGYRFKLKDARLDRFLQPQWWSKAYGYLSFVVLMPHFNGLALECLHSFLPYITIDEGGKFSLVLERLHQWLCLEDYIYSVISVLNKEYLCRPSLVPIPPSMLGLRKSYSSHRSACLRIANARDWYLILLARFSFVIAHAEHSFRKHHSQIPHWFEFLTSKHSISQAWLSSIENSFVADFSVSCRRVGVFLNVFDPEEGQPEMTWFTSLNVPVWYRWTKENEAKVRYNPGLRYLQPPVEIIQSATNFFFKQPALHHQVPAAPLYESEVSNSCTSSSNNKDQGESKFLACRQKYLDSKPWEAFFLARAERNKQRELRETPQDRERRLNRERKPPTVSAEVYCWDWSMGDDIELVRERVNKCERDDILDLYSGDQSRYDSFANEWDCCEYFAPVVLGKYNADPDFSCDDLDLDLDIPDEAQQRIHENYVAQRVSQPLQTLPPPTMTASSIELDLTRPSGSINLLQYLSIYYGFVPPLPVPTSCPSIDRKVWDESLKNIGLRAGDHNPPLEGLSSSIVAFLQTLRADGKLLIDACDFLPGNRIAIDQRRLRDIIRKDGEYYFVSSTQLHSTSPWVVAITNAADALTVYRLLFETKTHSAQTLALALVEEGIRFHTFQPLPDTASSLSLKSIATKIPRRIRDYTFQPSDYEAYIAERSKLLLSPRGRAALLEGGIVWRLAKEHLGANIVLGPSVAVVEFRLGLSHLSTDGKTYWDDKLTEDELGVICGLHHCFTGNGEQISYTSWWPLRTQWNNSQANGYNWHRWTEWDEIWYQDRLSSILAGDPKKGIPYSASTWRSKLKGATSWRKVTQTMEAESARLF